MSYASALPGDELAGSAASSPDHAAEAAWVRLVEVLGAAQVVFALAAAALAVRGGGPRMALYAATMLAFGVSAVLLRTASREPRARALGVFYLLVAAGFAAALLNGVRELPPLVRAAGGLFRHLRIDSFSAYFFWLFVLDFPRRRPYERFGRVAVRLTRAAFALGLGLCLLVLLTPLLRSSGGGPGLFDPERVSSLYWPILFLIMAPALPYAVWRTRQARPDEARRARIMVFGLAAGLAPDLLLTLVTPLAPALHRWLLTPPGPTLLLIFVNLPLLTLPIITAYAVLVQHALDLRFFVRRALSYALARSTLSVAAALPLLAGGALLYVRRNEPVARLASDGTGSAVVVAAAAAFLALRLRSGFLLRLDRRFFREQYDLRTMVGGVVERVRRVSSAPELQGLLREQIGTALHVHTVDLFLREDVSGRLASADGRIRPLGADAALARRLEGARAPLVVDWQWPGEWLRTLPAQEQQWLADAGHALHVPVRASDGALLGVLALGEKLSELPYTRDDRLALGLVADAVALALAGPGMVLLKATDPDRPAFECPDCGRIHELAAEACERCSGTLSRAPLPLVLAGKFRLVERVGRGAMGVVYRARDLALERDVAIKTLPRTSAGEAARLRHEARAMAAVSHPNLAAIYSVESCRATPLLVVEYLAGGTLADRLARERLRADEGLALAEALAHALAHLHDAGILHRDIKPSNIGFAEDGRPKLLDFGIARTLPYADDPALDPVRNAAWPAAGRSGAPGGSSGNELPGTPLYLSPEAIRGEPASPSLDLWALCMVLYEALAGRHPMAGERTAWLALRRLAQADLPDIRTVAPEVPASVATVLRTELGRDPAERTRSARALAGRFQQLRTHALVAA